MLLHYILDMAGKSHCSPKFDINIFTGVRKFTQWINSCQHVDFNFFSEIKITKKQSLISQVKLSIPKGIS